MARRRLVKTRRFIKNHIYEFIDSTGHHDWTLRVVSDRVYTDSEREGTGHDPRYLRAVHVHTGPETGWKWKDTGDRTRIYLDETGTLVSDSPKRYYAEPDPEGRYKLELWGQKFEGPSTTDEIHPGMKLRIEREVAAEKDRLKREAGERKKREQADQEREQKLKKEFLGRQKQRSLREVLRG